MVSNSTVEERVLVRWQGKKHIFPELKTRKIKSLNKPFAILSKKKEDSNF